MKINDFKKVIDILIELGLGEEFLEANHDVIYLPIERSDISDSDFKKLEKLGAWEDEESDCLSVWC